MGVRSGFARVELSNRKVGRHGKVETSQIRSGCVGLDFTSCPTSWVVQVELDFDLLFDVPG
jgi:hypothetical protein